MLVRPLYLKGSDDCRIYTYITKKNLYGFKGFFKSQQLLLCFIYEKYRAWLIAIAMIAMTRAITPMIMATMATSLMPCLLGV